MAEDIAALPMLYASCTERLGQPRPLPATERVAGRQLSGISLDDRVVTARGAMLSIPASWAGLVVAERRLSTRPERTVTALSAFLQLHLSWLASHPAAGDFADEMSEVVRVARRAVEQRSVVRVDVGQCPVQGCEATASALVGAEHSGAPSEVTCAEGHSIPPHRWLLLARNAVA